MNEQIAQQALLLLVEVMDNDDAPPPSVVPLNDGGVQVEWHRHGRNLEKQFIPSLVEEPEARQG